MIKYECSSFFKITLLFNIFMPIFFVEAMEDPKQGYYIQSEQRDSQFTLDQTHALLLDASMVIDSKVQADTYTFITDNADENALNVLANSGNVAALFIKARKLAQSSELQLQNVAFATMKRALDFSYGEICANYKQTNSQNIKKIIELCDITGAKASIAELAYSGNSNAWSLLAWIESNYGLWQYKANLIDKSGYQNYIDLANDYLNNGYGFAAQKNTNFGPVFVSKKLVGDLSDINNADDDQHIMIAHGDDNSSENAAERVAKEVQDKSKSVQRVNDYTTSLANNFRRQDSPRAKKKNNKVNKKKKIQKQKKNKPKKNVQKNTDVSQDDQLNVVQSEVKNAIEEYRPDIKKLFDQLNNCCTGKQKNKPKTFELCNQIINEFDKGQGNDEILAKVNGIRAGIYKDGIKTKKKTIVKKNYNKAIKDYEIAIELGCKELQPEYAHVCLKNNELDKASENFEKVIQDQSYSEKERVAASWQIGSICFLYNDKKKAIERLIDASKKMSFEKSCHLLSAQTDGKTLHEFEKYMKVIQLKKENEQYELDFLTMIGNLFAKSNDERFKKRKQSGLDSVSFAAQKRNQNVQKYINECTQLKSNNGNAKNGNFKLTVEDRDLIMSEMEGIGNQLKGTSQYFDDVYLKIVECGINQLINCDPNQLCMAKEIFFKGFDSLIKSETLTEDKKLIFNQLLYKLYKSANKTQSFQELEILLAKQNKNIHEYVKSHEIRLEKLYNSGKKAVGNNDKVTGYRYLQQAADLGAINASALLARCQIKDFLQNKDDVGHESILKLYDNVLKGLLENKWVEIHSDDIDYLLDKAPGIIYFRQLYANKTDSTVVERFVTLFEGLYFLIEKYGFTERLSKGFLNTFDHNIVIN